MTIRPYLRLLRPKQWIKNAFVFAPLIFAKELFDPIQALTAARAFLTFSLAASCVYVLNDILDAPSDRRHPTKCRRPIAAGVINPVQAWVLLFMLATLVAAVAFGMRWQFLFVVATYIGLNILYSFRLKEVVLLDVFIIAAGFMLRVVGGAYAIGVQVSSWLVLCSLFVSLFLGFAKRRGELILSQREGVDTKRKVLQQYSVGFLDQMLTLSATGAVIAYALYTVAPRTVEMFGTERLIATTVFVCYGVFRYLYLIHTDADTENPANAVISDLPILITVVLWIVACALIIYTRGGVLAWLSW